AEEFLQALWGDNPSLAPLTPLLIARTGGNPFFLEESVHTLVETGALVGERRAYRLAKALDSLQVPATVQAVLAARIDRVPPEDKRLLQTAAVIGTEVPYADRLADQVERLAHHAVRGELWDKTLAYCRQAGDRAEARSAYREAVAYFEQALAALAHLPERHETLEQAIDLRLDLRNAL